MPVEADARGFRPRTKPFMPSRREGRIDLEPIITSRIAREDVVEQGFKKLIENNEIKVKILIHP